jgi:hypothetical protein
MSEESDDYYCDIITKCIKVGDKWKMSIKLIHAFTIHYDDESTRKHELKHIDIFKKNFEEMKSHYEPFEQKLYDSGQICTGAVVFMSVNDDRIPVIEKIRKQLKQDVLEITREKQGEIDDIWGIIRRVFFKNPDDNKYLNSSSFYTLRRGSFLSTAFKILS